MYTATSILTLRARSSLRRCLLDPDSSAEGSATAGDLTSLLRGVSLSPRVLYGYYYLRQSALLRWNPCRGYSRVAVAGLRGRGGERRRLYCCCCDGGGGEQFEEAVGLLWGVGEGCCEEGRSGFVGKAESCCEGGGFGLGGGARGGACGNVKSFGEDECLLGRNELDMPYATFSGDLRHQDGCKGRVDFEGIAGRRHRRLEKENSSQRGSRASLRANSRKDEVESSSSGDGWKKDFTEDSTLQLRREHTREENRRLREEIGRLSKMSDAKKSIEENRRLREEMARLLKTSRVLENVEEENRRLREEMDRLLRTSQVKENVVEENKRLREEMERISRISDVKEDTIEENIRLLEEANRRSREEIERRSKTSEAKESITEENRKLREDIERISKTFEMNEWVRKDSSSENASEVKVENGGKMSALTANLIAEVTRQRQEINLLRENYESLLRRSQVHDTSLIRSSECNIASTSKSEDNSLMSSSLASLVEELRRQSMVIEQLSRSYHELATSAQIFKIDSQRVSSSEKVYISQLRDREKVSESSVTLIREGRDMHEDDSSTSKKTSFPELSASEKSKNLSEAKFVGEVREQHRYTDQYREDIQNAGTSELLISDNKSTSVLENILVSQYRQDAGSAETSELHQSDSKLTSSSVNMSASKQEGTVASMILSTVSKLGSSSGKASASRQEDRTVSMILSTDNKLSSTSGNISASRQEDKMGSTILSDMTLISDKREQHNYAEQLRIDRQKYWKISDDNISMERSSFSGAASAFDTTSLSGQPQHGYVDDQKIGSLKYTVISATEEQVTDEVLTENPSVVLGVEVFKENDKLFQEDGSSAATTSGDSSTSYISADAQLRLDEHTREEKLSPERHGILESASRLDLSSSQYIGEFVGTLQEEMAGMINSGASSGRSGIHVSEISNEAESASVEQGSSVSEESSLKYNKEEPSQLPVLPERRGPSEEIWDLTGPSKDPPLKDTVQKNSSEVPADSTAVPSVVENAIIKRSGRSFWSYIADIIRLGWHPHATSQTSTFGSATRTSVNESSSGDAWFSGREQDEDEQTKTKKKATAKGSGFAKRNTSKERSASHSSKSESKGPDLEVDTLITVGISTEVGDSKEPLPEIGPSEIIKDEGMGKGVLSSQQTSFLSTGTLGGFDVAVESSVMLGSKVRMENETIGGISSANHTVDLTAGQVSSGEQMVYSTAECISSTKQPVDLTAGGISSATQAAYLTVGGVSSAGKTVAGGLSSAMQGVGSTAVGISSSMQTVGGLSSAMQAAGSTAGGISSSSALVDLPVSFGLELEIAGIGQVPMPNILNESIGKEPLEGGLPEIVETEVKDGDLRRRKFQRIKQIPRVQFDEWDEERMFESEQRKIDEFFMREALLEAKKAAESWEVPIGAVLVQDGKVIARGGNLVEELRDSTAHAEMICIREASNYLKSWRLSETTLYVTLEPCAMCAGAILQARIDTVVWGAPNKLLGADGSWVRLFPGSNESSSQTSSQTIGPVHPFHPKILIRRGILESECADVMQRFFQLRRKKDKEDEEPRPHTTISAYPAKLMAKMHNIFSMMFCL